MLTILKSLKVLVFIVAVLLISSAPKAYADDPCSAITDQPVIYQIDRSPTQAVLYFAPLLDDQIQSYTILYGLKPEDERYSLTVNQGVTNGALAITIGNLLPDVQYSYKVMANTSCTSSPWSAWISDKAVTKGTEKIIPASSLPVTGSETLVLEASMSCLAFVGGLSLFFFLRKRSTAYWS